MLDTFMCTMKNKIGENVIACAVAYRIFFAQTDETKLDRQICFWQY